LLCVLPVNFIQGTNEILVLLLSFVLCCFFRCNFALMLLAEIVSDQRDITWIIHLPLLLHVGFLGTVFYTFELLLG